MGLIAKIKEFFSAQKYIFQAMAKMDRQNAAYAALSTEELGKLIDDELISAVLYRIDKKLDTILGKKKKGTPADWSKQLSGSARVVYILSYFESDLQTGGMEYFFKRNSGFSPLVSNCLGEVGAEEHQALYDQMLAAHGYDWTYAEYLEYQDELTAFDEAYRALPTLESVLVPYLRAHIEEF